MLRAFFRDLCIQLRSPSLKLADFLLKRFQTHRNFDAIAGLVIILCGVVLALRRTFDWRIPVAVLLAVAIASCLVWVFDRGEYPSPVFMLGSGGLLFGAVYMATDPVTSPITPRGAWIFGIGVGVLVVLIRVWGGLPEGVMYAILLMNATTPLIDRVSQPRAFGRGGGVKTGT